MAEQSLKEKTAKGLFWGGISNGLQQLISLCIGIFLMKLLSPADYGMVGLLAIFTGIASVIQESGFTAALTNREQFSHDDYNSVFWFNLIISCLLYVVLFVAAPFIADFYHQPELIPLARTIFLSFVFSSLGITHNAILFKKLMVKQRALIDTTSLAISGIIAIIIAIKGMGYWALVANLLVFNFVGTILRWHFSGWKPTLNFKIAPIKEMFGFSSKLLISNIFTQIQLNIFSVLLGKFYTKNDVGIFSQGFKWANMGTTLIRGMVNGVAQPVFATTNDERERQAQIFRKTIRFISFASFPFLLGIAFVSTEFITLIDTKWLPCIPVLQLYCCWGAIAPIQLLYTQLIISHGKSDIYFWNTIAFGIFQISIAVLSLPYGIYYLALANLITSLLYQLVWHWYASKLIPITLWQILRDSGPYLLITLIVFAATWGITYRIEIVYLRFLAKIIIATLLYVLVMRYSKSAIFNESVNFLLKRKR